MNRERYDYQEPEPQPASAFVPEVKYGCICGPAFESEGRWWQPVNPSCMRHNRTAEANYVAEFKYGGTSRTVGVVHGRGGSRNSF